MEVEEVIDCRGAFPRRLCWFMVPPSATFYARIVACAIIENSTTKTTLPQSAVGHGPVAHYAVI